VKWSTKETNQEASLDEDEENRDSAGAPGIQSAQVSARSVSDPAVLAGLDAKSWRLAG
jgi:hypothetical protein